MGLLSPTELDSMRHETDRYRPDLCDVFRDATSSDDYGGESTNRITVASDLPCSIEASTVGTALGDLSLIAGRATERALFVLLVAHDAPDLDVGDYVVVTTLGSRDGRVISAPQKTSWEIEIGYACEDLS